MKMSGPWCGYEVREVPSRDRRTACDIFAAVNPDMGNDPHIQHIVYDYNYEDYFILEAISSIISHPINEQNRGPITDKLKFLVWLVSCPMP